MADQEPDVRAYAETRGISRAEARVELGLEPEDDTLEEGEARGPGLTPPKGHNQKRIDEALDPDGSAHVALTNAAKAKLKQTVAKIEKLEEEKKEVAEQIKDVYQEAKSMGYDVKALRALVRLRRMDRQEREEAQAILETYMLATGDIEFYD